jgi:hypothetical protein
MFLRWMALFAFFALSTLHAEKVLIFTYSYNRPDFIEIQYKTFKKFLKDDFDFVVCNDASNIEDRNKIKKMCAALNIPVIPIPPAIHKRPYLQRFPGDDWNNPSVRNCNVVQYSLDKLGFQHKGIVALFDSDMFLVRDFSIKEYLKGYHLAAFGTERAHVNYLWIGLVFLDMGKMPNPTTINFNCGPIDGQNVDAGGFSHYYLKNNPTAKVRYMNRTGSNPALSAQKLLSEGYDKYQIALIHTGVDDLQFFHDAHFLHYTAGSNWNKKSNEYHILKTQQVNNYINAILK